MSGNIFVPASKDLIIVLKWPNLVHNVINAVHLDIKPENLLLNKLGELKIADFGISELMCPNECLYVSNGTRLFQPPEIYKKNSVRGPEVDIWSLGVTFFYLSFSYHPFFSTNSNELKEKILNDSPKFPNFADPLFVRVLTRCLDKNPASRITLFQLMKDDWITKSGQYPMIREDKRKYLKVTSKEIEGAITQIILETNVFAISKMQAKIHRVRIKNQGEGKQI